MSLFEFVSVIIAVVLALCAGQLLLGVSALIKARLRVRAFVPHTIWIGLLFLLVLQHWWAQWDFRGVDWTYPDLPLRGTGADAIVLGGEPLDS